MRLVEMYPSLSATAAGLSRRTFAMSSWDAYISTNLIGSGAVTGAGIYDLAGNPWAYSDGFAAQVAEVKAVSDAMASDPTSLAGTGVTVAGIKYMYINGDKQQVYAKKGNTGVVFFKCNTCVIVGTHNDTIQPGNCKNAVSKLGDYLVENSV